MEDAGKPVIKGLKVHKSTKRRAKSVPVVDQNGKVVGWKYHKNDMQPVEFVTKDGEHVKAMLDVTGRYGDQNHAQRIPSIYKHASMGKRRDKKKKKLWKDNLCHRMSSYPGTEQGYYDRLKREGLPKKLSNLAKAWIGVHGSDKGIGLDPQIKELIAECYAYGVEKRIIRRALRGANV